MAGGDLVPVLRATGDPSVPWAEKTMERRDFSGIVTPTADLTRTTGTTDADPELAVTLEQGVPVLVQVFAAFKLSTDPTGISFQWTAPAAFTDGYTWRITDSGTGILSYSVVPEASPFLGYATGSVGTSNGFVLSELDMHLTPTSTGLFSVNWGICTSVTRIRGSRIVVTPL
jgi:hypothetical protein